MRDQMKISLSFNDSLLYISKMRFFFTLIEKSVLFKYQKSKLTYLCMLTLKYNCKRICTFIILEHTIKGVL